ncbi:alpha/beta hydrolase [Sphingomonas sp.]|uniref:alpha/beta hydrolase n=1 Tax=Sphingomonas sp. TaxID=28214 RepID=UPI002CFEF5E9|nr:alpha/beta hydrolase [Sphingomonas sp.]HWK35431.1 alpha/beta hydrolase [Sphingomonas sp.]
MSVSRHLVDPELLPLLDLIPHVAMSTDTLAQVRERRLPLPATMTGGVDKVERTIAGPPGAADVAITCYGPAGNADALPTILHIHGGGYVAGRAASGEPRHRLLAGTLGCRIVSVDYRLAPETPFPGALLDCHAALDWIFASGADGGHDLTRIGVMGESAGGGLAAALALYARDERTHPLAFVHLTYPMLDDRTGSLVDPHPTAGEFVWTAADNRFSWSSLLGGAPGGDGVSAHAAPARAADLSGLPPLYLATGALDLFIDENLDFARRAARAGVPVELHVYPGAFHGFDLVPGAAVSQRMRDDGAAALARAMAPR